MKGGITKARLKLYIRYSSEQTKTRRYSYQPIRYNYKELARSAPIETFDLASNQYPVFDNHKLAEQSIVNRNRYRVIEDRKPIVKLASWKTAKQISFTRGSRSVSINCNADPESVGVLVDTSKKCYVHEKKELRSKKRQIFKLTNFYDDTTEIPVRQEVLLPLVKLCEKKYYTKGVSENTIKTSVQYVAGSLMRKMRLRILIPIWNSYVCFNKVLWCNFVDNLTDLSFQLFN